jgi:hypothetical protein
MQVTCIEWQWPIQRYSLQQLISTIVLEYEDTAIVLPHIHAYCILLWQHGIVNNIHTIANKLYLPHVPGFDCIFGLSDVGKRLMVNMTDMTDMTIAVPTAVAVGSYRGPRLRVETYAVYDPTTMVLPSTPTILFLLDELDEVASFPDGYLAKVQGQSIHDLMYVAHIRQLPPGALLLPPGQDSAGCEVQWNHVSFRGTLVCMYLAMAA